MAVGEELVVDPDLIGFFLLRRNLDDLVDWLGGVLDEQRPAAQRRADLEGVRWCLSRWGALQAWISEVRLVLNRQQPPRATLTGAADGEASCDASATGSLRRR